MRQSWTRWQMLGCLGCLITAPSMAAPRVGPLEVRSSAASPACFTIPQAEERRAGAPQFDAISVTDGANGKLILWSMSMPRERTFAVSFRMCIPYAGRLPVLPRTVAAKLVPGRIYHVTMTARTPAPGAPRVYLAWFCLRTGNVRQLPGAASVCPA